LRFENLVGDGENIEAAGVDERVADADDTDALPAPAVNLVERHVDDAQDLSPGGALDLRLEQVRAIRRDDEEVADRAELSGRLQETRVGLDRHPRQALFTEDERRAAVVMNDH